jgi:hypothetical protein
VPLRIASAWAVIVSKYLLVLSADGDLRRFVCTYWIISNCLVNLASSQTITLSWGAKKEEHKEQRKLVSNKSLQVGNLVVVENHGNQWPHKAQTVDIDMENKLPLIRWETT